MIFTRHFASLGLIGLLAVPFALAACSKVSNFDDVCDDAGKACVQSDAEIVECKSGLAQTESLSSNIGCRTQFDAYGSCFVDNYETPTAAECASNDGFSNATRTTCEAKLEEYTSCLLAACAAAPEKCTQ